MLRAMESALTPDSRNERYPQCPGLNSPAQFLQMHAYGFFYGVSICYIWSSSLPAAFYFSQNSQLFQRTLPSHVMPQVGQLQFCHFCLQQCFALFQALFSQGPLVHLSGGPEYLHSPTPAPYF